MVSLLSILLTYTLRLGHDVPHAQSHFPPFHLLYVLPHHMFALDQLLRCLKVFINCLFTTAYCTENVSIHTAKINIRGPANICSTNRNSSKTQRKRLNYFNKKQTKPP